MVLVGERRPRHPVVGPVVPTIRSLGGDIAILVVGIFILQAFAVYPRIDVHEGGLLGNVAVVVVAVHHTVGRGIDIVAHLETEGPVAVPHIGDEAACVVVFVATAVGGRELVVEPPFPVLDSDVAVVGIDPVQVYVLAPLLDGTVPFVIVDLGNTVLVVEGHVLLGILFGTAQPRHRRGVPHIALIVVHAALGIIAIHLARVVGQHTVVVEHHGLHRLQRAVAVVDVNNLRTHLAARIHKYMVEPFPRISIGGKCQPCHQGKHSKQVKLSHNHKNLVQSYIF